MHSVRRSATWFPRNLRNCSWYNSGLRGSGARNLALEAGLEEGAETATTEANDDESSEQSEPVDSDWLEKLGPERGTKPWWRVRADHGQVSACEAHEFPRLPKVLFDFEAFSRTGAQNSDKYHLKTLGRQMREVLLLNTTGDIPLPLSMCGLGNARGDTEGDLATQLLDEFHLRSREDIRKDLRPLTTFLAEERPRKVVMLSPDAMKPLVSVEDYTTYVICCAMDTKKEIPFLSHKIADHAQIESRRLPISEIFFRTLRTKRQNGMIRPRRFNLSLHTAFQCLQDAYVIRNWRSAMLQSLPMRLFEGKLQAKFLSEADRAVLLEGAKTGTRNAKWLDQARPKCWDEDETRNQLQIAEQDAADFNEANIIFAERRAHRANPRAHSWQVNRMRMQDAAEFNKANTGFAERKAHRANPRAHSRENNQMRMSPEERRRELAKLKEATRGNIWRLLDATENTHGPSK